MNNHVAAGRLRPGTAPDRILSAGGVQLDEARGELRVNGQRRAVEAKPLALLHALMTDAGAIVSKRTLITAAWGNADHISEASLTTAMSKLRTALGAERGLIEVVHSQGYRLSAPVEVCLSARPPCPATAFEPGQPVPGRPGWHLQRQRDLSKPNGVWLAHDPATGERRVFTFVETADQLAMLEREVAIAQQLHEAAGTIDDVVLILDWNFDEPPFFVEREYGGPLLADWAGTADRLAGLGVETRVAMVARLARVIAAAHEAGVMHGDLRP